MFPRLGQFVSRHWVAMLVAWGALVAAMHFAAPRWEDVTHDGDFAYLPKDTTSVRGEKLLEEAFPEAVSKSQVVLVVARSDGKLRPEDYAVAERLVQKFTPRDEPGEQAEPGPVVSVWDYESQVIGDKLISPAGYQGQAALVVLQLRQEFMAVANMKLMDSIYATLDQLRREKDFPAGLQLGVTGSAAIGTDMLFAAEESIRNTELMTILLVVLILILVYRAPGLVIIPLATIAVSFWVAMDLLALAAHGSGHLSWLDFKVFKTTKIFVIVVLFGAGTDYCLFLISRYREELRRGRDSAAASAVALGQVGNALAASALTTIFGLATMMFADFGKFRSGGPAIAMCLVVALAASVTLAPALLRAAGKTLFWPLGVGRNNGERSGSPDGGLLAPIWQRLADGILARPGLILVGSVLVMAPLAWWGLSPQITYDLLNELRADRPSVQGTQLLRQHFLAGQTGPVTVLAYVPGGAFDRGDGEKKIARLTKFLYELEYTDAEGNRLRPVLSVRSLTEPLGDPPGSFNPLSAAGRRKLMALKHPKTLATFLSHAPGYRGRLTRFDLVFQYDPFSAEAVDLLTHVEEQLRELSAGTLEAWPENVPFDWRAEMLGNWRGAEFELVGATAGIRDLERVTTSDRRLIQQLCVIAVLAVLIAILRRPGVSIYLVASVLFGYLVTIGATELFFGWLYGPTFRGLDWKVPIFLFVLLVALGADYNIYLVTRALEEQKRLGPRAGLRTAVIRTGGIITSCGLIMAGTFASMATGTLGAMQQLGFALAVGVLLDTFVIRTVLVPAFLALLAREKPVATGETSVPGPKRKSRAATSDAA